MGFSIELLRAHYRAEQVDTAQRVLSRSGLPIPCNKKWYANGVGDLENPPEFTIADPEIEELN